MNLPEISLIAQSGKDISESFSRFGHILSQYLKCIQLAVAADKDFTNDPFNSVILGLFSKLRCHYHSSVLLEASPDQLGRKFLTEQIYETAVTLTYLLEEADEGTFSDYVAASIYQSHHLLAEIADKLQIFPNHSGLLGLKAKLESCIDCNQQDLPAFSSIKLVNAYTWGLPEVDNTAKRGAVLGLNFLANPVRTINLRVEPASWSDLQLNYSTSAAGDTDSEAGFTVNFTALRDTVHLCLHTTRIFLDEVVDQGIENLNKEQLEQDLNALFAWFYDAHAAFRSCFSEEAAELSPYN